MSSVLLSLPEIYNAYKVWISKNPVAASDYESSVKWISYFLAARVSNSHVVSELIYCLSNLLILFNDRIINKASKIDPPNTGEKIKLWLTTIEYSEVFLELSAHKLWGSTGKWLVVIAIQVFKCISRLILIYQHKEPIVQTPPIAPLERRRLPKHPSNLQYTTVGDLAQSQFDSVSFTLKRSGRIVRKVDASPPLAVRTWKPLDKPSACVNMETIEQSIAGLQLMAETVYVLKPIVHLASMACFGTNTWKPWMVSLVLDMYSLQIYRSSERNRANSLSPQQKLQISKRTMLLVLYLIRSPFYERHSRNKINALLVSLSNNVPLAGFICNPLLQYLPFWQSKYFYMWST